MTGEGYKALMKAETEQAKKFGYYHEALNYNFYEPVVVSTSSAMPFTLSTFACGPSQTNTHKYSEPITYTPPKPKPLSFKQFILAYFQSFKHELLQELRPTPKASNPLPPGE